MCRHETRGWAALWSYGTSEGGFCSPRKTISIGVEKILECAGPPAPMDPSSPGRLGARRLSGMSILIAQAATNIHLTLSTWESAAVSGTHRHGKVRLNRRNHQGGGGGQSVWCYERSNSSRQAQNLDFPRRGGIHSRWCGVQDVRFGQLTRQTR